MEIHVATLCDFAQVREGMLFVSSGGISVLRRTEYPAQFGVMLALLFETSKPEIEGAVEVRVSVDDADGGKVYDVAAGLQGDPGDRDFGGAPIHLPLPFDLRGVVIPSPGRYSVNIECPGYASNSKALRFSAELVPQNPKLPGMG